VKFFIYILFFSFDLSSREIRKRQAQQGQDYKLQDKLLKDLRTGF
jgi:hypothetical protein